MVSHCFLNSATSLLAPFLSSIWPTLAVGGACLYQAVACIAVPQPFLLDVLSSQAWNRSLSPPKNNYWETPASLKLTVSFLASILLNTMCTLLGSLIINSHTAGIDHTPIFIPVKDKNQMISLIFKQLQPERQRGEIDQRMNLFHYQLSTLTGDSHLYPDSLSL